jgi:hypothetical protein
MSRLFRHRRGAFPGLALSAVLIGGFSLGLFSGRQTLAQTAVTAQPGDHELSRKAWRAAPDTTDRVAAAERQALVRGAITTSR